MVRRRKLYGFGLNTSRPNMTLAADTESVSTFDSARVISGSSNRPRSSADIAHPQRTGPSTAMVQTRMVAAEPGRVPDKTCRWRADMKVLLDVQSAAARAP